MCQLLRSLVLVCVVALAAACGSEIVTPASPLAGRYVLRTVGGTALPVQVAGLPASYRYVAGSLELRADGTLVDVIRINNVVDSVLGTYTVSGEAVSVTSNGLGSYTLRWDTRGALHANWAEGEYIYKRD